jgi:hypothetical protein
MQPELMVLFQVNKHYRELYDLVRSLSLHQIVQAQGVQYFHPFLNKPLKKVTLLIAYCLL